MSASQFADNLESLQENKQDLAALACEVGNVSADVAESLDAKLTAAAAAASAAAAAAAAVASAAACDTAASFAAMSDKMDSMHHRHLEQQLLLDALMSDKRHQLPLCDSVPNSKIRLATTPQLCSTLSSHALSFNPERAFNHVLRPSLADEPVTQSDVIELHTGEVVAI